MNIKEKPYLLDPNVQDDDPLSIYKSFGQIISENYLSIFIIIGVLFLISFMLYFLKKREKNKIEEFIAPPIDPYKEALEGINELQRQQQKLDPKPFVFKLSEILRIYVQNRFNMPAMELTGEEFIIESASNPFFQNYEDLLREFVDRGDRVKYSKETADTNETNLLLDSALHFVKDSHSRITDQESTDSQNQKTHSE